MAKEHLFGWDESFEYFECSKCGCIQLAQEVNDLARFYGGTYGTLSPSWLKQQLRTIMYRAAFSPSEVIARMMSAFTPGCNYGLMRTLRGMPKDIDILDVGCGSGRLLQSLRILGFSGRLVGIDAFLDTESFHNGVHIYPASVSELGGSSRFDVISLMHTFEHIAEQDETLASIRRLLKPNGICVITIPISGSAQWKKHGTQWVQMDPPRHVFLHTPKSLGILANLHGFKITRMIPDSSAFQFWGTELVRKGVRISPMSKAYIRSLWRMPFDMLKAESANARYAGDQATFILQ